MRRCVLIFLVARLDLVLLGLKEVVLKGFLGIATVNSLEHQLLCVHDVDPSRPEDQYCHHSR
jgi:hypothetical protein